MFNLKFYILALIFLLSACGDKHSANKNSILEKFDLPIFGGAKSDGHSSEYASMIMYAVGEGVSRVQNEKPNFKVYEIYSSTNFDEVSKFYDEELGRNDFEKLEPIPIPKLNAEYKVYQAKRKMDKKKVLVTFLKNENYRERTPFGFLILIWTDNSQTEIN